MEIKGGWLTDFENNYFAPCTLFSQVKDESDGTSLTDYILTTALKFTVIDTNITNIKNNITTIEGNITNIKNNITTIEGNITNILGLKFQTNLNKSELGSIVIGNTVVSGVTGVLPIANGGTGASTLSANKLLYSNSSQITTSKHYIDNDKIQINVDSSDGTTNFYVNGSSIFNGSASFKGKFIVNNSEEGPTIRFGSLKTSDDDANLRGKIRYMFKSDSTLVNNSQFIFEQNSYNSTTGAKLSYMDTFKLPETAADKTKNNTYNIITSKGGTISGNLTISGALNLPDAGLIRIKSDNDAALDAFGSIAIGPDNNQQIRIDNNEIISVKYDSGTKAYVSSTLHLNGIAGGSVNIGTGENGIVNIGTGSGGKTQTGSLLPSKTKTYNLGASATRWMNSYVSGYCYCGALVVGKSGAEDTAATGYGTGSVSALTAIVGRVYFKVLS